MEGRTSGAGAAGAPLTSAAAAAGWETVVVDAERRGGHDIYTAGGQENTELDFLYD